MQLDHRPSEGCKSFFIGQQGIFKDRSFGRAWSGGGGGVMLLSNYGRDQVADSSGFDGSQQTPLLHTVGVVQPLLNDVSSSTSGMADRSSLKPPPPEQLLAAAAACQPRPGQQQQQQQAGQQQQQQERRLKPHSDQVLKCPRCDSMNTKFCYYNNYSLTQPRHFCKNCKRYWTKGGALRNVPVGGGCRKNKRVKQRQPEHPSGHPPASSDEAGPPNGGVGGGGAAGSAAAGGGAMGGNDGASSSGVLQQEFPAVTSSAGLYSQVTKAGNGLSLPFDRADGRMFPGAGSHPPPPISINWATGQMLGSHPQQFDPNILGLNLPAAPIKQEHGDAASDINSIFDPSSLGMGTHGAMNEALSSYVTPVENYGLNGGSSGSDLMWRFPQQPKLVSLLEDGSDQDQGSGRHHVLLDLETGGGDKMKQQQQQQAHKGKGSAGDVSSSDYDQHGDSSSPDQWQPSSTEAFFEQSGNETGYWTGGGWSSDLHAYGANHPHHHHQVSGNHQLL